MRRLLSLALWLVGSTAFAQTSLPVRVTYSAAANTYAASLGVTVESMVGNAIAATNANYSQSGISAAWNALGYGADGGGWPADTRPAGEQIAFLQNGVLPWIAHQDASVLIHVIDTGAGSSTGAILPAGPYNGPRDGVIVVPIRGVADQLELALSRILGDNPAGYSYRGRKYGWQGGQTNDSTGAICMHTRESGPTDTSTVVPYLSPVYNIQWTGMSPYNMAPTAAIACEAFRQQQNTVNGCAPGTCATATVTGTAPTQFCSIKNGSGAQIMNPGISYNTFTGGATVTCTEIAENRYSSPSLTDANGAPLGDSTHDSVTPMNAKASGVAVWATRTDGYLRQARAAALAWWQFW